MMSIVSASDQNPNLLFELIESEIYPHLRGTGSENDIEGDQTIMRFALVCKALKDDRILAQVREETKPSLKKAIRILRQFPKELLGIFNRYGLSIAFLPDVGLPISVPILRTNNLLYFSVRQRNANLSSHYFAVCASEKRLTLINNTAFHGMRWDIAEISQFVERLLSGTDPDWTLNGNVPHLPLARAQPLPLPAAPPPLVLPAAPPPLVLPAAPPPLALPAVAAPLPQQNNLSMRRYLISALAIAALAWIVHYAFLREVK